MPDNQEIRAGQNVLTGFLKMYESLEVTGLFASGAGRALCSWDRFA